WMSLPDGCRRTGCLRSSQAAGAFIRAAVRLRPCSGEAADGKIGTGVDGATVIPHQEVAQLPDVLVDELAPFADRVELLQDRVALLNVDPFDPRRHQAVDEQRLAAGVGMRDEHGMIVMRDVADVA